ncbi:MAG TPA: hypothetical protein VGD69_18595 [Herpetosiphonaceae bacterium]
MQEDRTQDTPQSPETQPAHVREELDQDNVTHEGTPRSAEGAGPTPSSHFGAVEDDQSGHVDQTPVTPPMDGPYDLIGDDNRQDTDVDPQTEIPGGG